METVEYEFTVPFAPHAWQRPGETRDGRRFDTTANKEAKRIIAMVARAAGVKPIQGAVELRATFLFRRPKTHLKKNGDLRKGVPVHHIHNPDVSNLTKLVEDALIGIAFKDDRQIIANHVKKDWTTEGDSMSVITLVGLEKQEEINRE